MSINFPAKTTYFLKLGLLFVLLIQWTMPTIEKGRNISINFSDITFEKCNDPEHSHPPISQRDTPEDPEKFVNSNLNSSFIVSSFQKYFDINAKNIFEKPETIPESLSKYFPSSRGPPYLEV